MSANSKIEWTDHTFNPWLGCTKVSPACDHCYAEVSTPSRTLNVVWGPHAERRRTTPQNWKVPKRWNDQADAFMAKHGRRQRVFCASLADVFDNAVQREWRDDLATLILDTPSLDWLLLTKRIGNVGAMLGEMFLDGPPANVRIGATICNQDEADRDIPKLLALGLPNFLSIEPLLGPVDLKWQLTEPTGKFRTHEGRRQMELRHHGKLHWVIVGGESGPQARPMHPDWATGLRDQCEAAGVPFLFKQWGEWKPISQMEEPEYHVLYRSRVKAEFHEDQREVDDSYGRDCTVDNGMVHLDGALHDILAPNAFLQGTGAMQMFKIGKKAAGRLLDGRTWDEVPA